MQASCMVSIPMDSQIGCVYSFLGQMIIKFAIYLFVLIKIIYDFLWILLFELIWLDHLVIIAIVGIRLILILFIIELIGCVPLVLGHVRVALVISLIVFFLVVLFIIFIAVVVSFVIGLIVTLVVLPLVLLVVHGLFIIALILLGLLSRGNC